MKRNKNMKNITITVKCFEKGDYVITPDGVGIVIRNESFSNEEEFIWSDVLVQHKFGNSSNCGNKPVEIEHDLVSLIGKEKYNKDKDWKI
jgi:hypothetical protein